MLRFLRKKKFGYVDCYIVLNGDHDVEIEGLKGISLKRVNRNVYDNHKGLKYWISSQIPKMQRHSEELKKLSSLVRIDIFNLVFGKKVKRTNGVISDRIHK
jgi:hypothetical protein